MLSGNWGKRKKKANTSEQYLNQAWPQLSWLAHAIFCTSLPTQRSSFVLGSSPTVAHAPLGGQKKANRLLHQHGEKKTRTATDPYSR